VPLAPVQEEEEGGWLGRELSWASREAKAQWGGGGWPVGKEKKGRGWAKSPDGPAGCWSGWAESEENSFPNKI
jgi:hypothetical protein